MKMQISKSSGKAHLQVINEWQQARLKNGTKAKPTDALQSEFVARALINIAAKLGIAVTNAVVTVRSGFRGQSHFLRPVFSQPDQLREIFQDPKRQKPFCFKSKRAAFRRINREKYFYAGESKHFSFAALHPIDLSSHGNFSSFAGRIEAFHTNLWKAEKPRPVLPKVDTCFFAGRNKGTAKTGCIDLKHILAIYFKRDDQRLQDISIQGLLQMTEELFDGLDVIALIDARIFENEGLQLVTELLPEFSRKDIAPADKLAFALERLRELLTRHMVGRHGGDTEAKSPKLFYIATTFERVQAGKPVLHPRLEIYPHLYREEFTEASFFVTHRNIPSSTKFLLWRYLNSEKRCIVESASESPEEPGKFKVSQIETALEFDNVFEAATLGTKPLKSWQSQITPPESPDFLHLTKGDESEKAHKTKSPWEALNKAAEEDCRSIAAFVVEGAEVSKIGEVPIQCLPRGIFAIESHYEDGFSDADIDSLRIVFHGLAALIRLISHQHAPIDYRSRISRTFLQDAEVESRDNPNVLRLLFLVQKLDAGLLHKLLPQCRTFPREFDVSDATIATLDKIASICPPKGLPNFEERSEILHARMTNMQRLLFGAQKDSPFFSNELLAFLEACPENFTWASYLSCMAQTLGDRINAGQDLPTFTRMLPGFSASGMFMAIVDGEFRQVVKLSTAQKIRKENRLYRKWVRYRLVNAAHIPTAGWAFETMGQEGKDSALKKSTSILALPEGKNITSDGVLVSDLVSGGIGHGEVRTFLELVAIILCCQKKPSIPEKPTIPDLEMVISEISAVFTRHARLWNRVEELPYSDQSRAVLSAFRIPPVDTTERLLFDKTLSKLELIDKSHPTPLKFETLTRVWSQICSSSVGELRIEHFRICHGDLNSRNLTWAEGLHSFFLIDFEFVGPNLFGTDQIKLVINLLTELRLGLLPVQHPDKVVAIEELAVMHKEIETSLCYLSEIFSVLIGRGGVASLKHIANDKAKHNQCGLVLIIQGILETIDPDENFGQDSWRAHWAFMFLCAAAKEFTYTSSAVDAEDLKSLCKETRLDSISLSQLESRVGEHFRGRPSSTTLIANCVRHLITARLLIMFINALKASEDA